MWQQLTSLNVIELRVICTVAGQWGKLTGLVLILHNLLCKLYTVVLIWETQVKIVNIEIHKFWACTFLSSSSTKLNSTDACGSCSDLNTDEHLDQWCQISGFCHSVHVLAILGLLCSAGKYHSVLHNIQEEQEPHQFCKSLWWMWPSNWRIYLFLHVQFLLSGEYGASRGCAFLVITVACLNCAVHI